MAGGYDTDTVTRLETNLDDCPPEILGAAMERLLAAGALDVWFTPIQMKKHRPATMLSVLCDEANADALADLIFCETTAFGLRRDTVTRLKLERRFETVATEFGDVTVKLGLKAGAVVQVAPEFESCRSVAEKSGQPLRTIYDAALRGWKAIGNNDQG
jgi:pyridinium-3,5-bisthiocarboxylic acid mononucleotide nickel chelatase